MPEQSTILLRTHHADEHVRIFLERLIAESGHDVAVVPDERSGELDLGAVRKISLTDASLASLGVAVPKDAAWRCGDYSLALASRALPAVQYFWLLEADVRLGWENYRLFFDLYRCVESDFLATNFRHSEPAWRWARTVSPTHGVDVYRCLYAMVRLSKRAIRYVHARRQLASLAPPLDMGEWPNDEAFTATELVNAGFTCRDLNDIAHTYRGNTFSFARPHGLCGFGERGSSNFIYHPVLTGPAYIKKARVFCSTTTDMVAAQDVVSAASVEVGADEQTNLQAWFDAVRK